MKLKLSILFLLLFTFFYLSLLSPTFAVIKRVRKPKTGVSTYIPRGVKSSVRFRADRLGLLMNFSNFDNLKSGKYELVYTADGVEQYAGGSILPGDTETKTLLFATCSSGACTFHENITNCRLSIVSTLNDGTTVLKPYRIKV